MKRGNALTVVLALTCILGCGRSGLDTVPVVGTITYQGQPLIGGIISFHPIDATQGRPANAKIHPDGSFVAATLQSTPGVMPGQYKVSVIYLDRPLFEVAPVEANTVKTQIPSRYNKPETSDLMLSVPDDGNAVTYNIELSD